MFFLQKQDVETFVSIVYISRTVRKLPIDLDTIAGPSAFQIVLLISFVKTEPLPVFDSTKHLTPTISVATIQQLSTV